MTKHTLWLAALALLMASRNARSAPIPDAGIKNDFHRAHLGQFVFSEAKIVNDAPDPKLVRDRFDLTRPMKARLYLPTSIANLYDSLGPEYGREAQISIAGRLLVDGKEKSKWPILFVGNATQRETWTTWWYDLVAETPRPWNVISENEFESFFGRAVQSLAPGSHTLRLEILARKADGSDGPLMAGGECTLAFSAAQKAAWVAKYGEQWIFHPPGMPGPYRITLVNACAKPVSYSILRPGAVYEQTMGEHQNVQTGLGEGDQIVLGGQQLHVITRASNGQTVTLCR